MTSIASNVKSQLGGLVKHAAAQVAKTPGEILKNMVGGNGNGAKSDIPAMQDLEQGAKTAQSSGQAQPDDKVEGFGTKRDYDKYAELTDKKDEIELRQLRRKLHGEFGISGDPEEGMQRARVQREQAKDRKEQSEEREEKEKKVLLQHKGEESIWVRLAKVRSGAETSVGRKVAG